MTFSMEKDRISAVSPDGHTMGFILFPRINSGLVNIGQVSVLSDYRGQGVDEAMMDALLAHLEQSNRKAALTAPYAQQYLKTHPQWSHLLPGKIHFTAH